jgi:hypothetical protein
MVESKGPYLGIENRELLRVSSELFKVSGPKMWGFHDGSESGGGVIKKRFQDAVSIRCHKSWGCQLGFGQDKRRIVSEHAG